ncbi:hypothetical protein [Aliiglaciecola aliphaticivorans]
MKIQHLFTVSIILSTLSVISGCASQAVLDLTDQSVENQKLLAQQQNVIANAFDNQLKTEAEMVKLVGAELTKQCEIINRSTQKHAEALISNSKLKMRELFYEKTFIFQNTDYPQKFNTAYEPLAASFQIYQTQLKALENEQTLAPLDVDITQKILVKKTEILAIADRHSKDDLELRDDFFAEIIKSRTRLFDDINSEYASISLPANINCDGFTGQAQEIAAELLTLQASLAAHHGQLDTLNDSQLQTLLTLQNNLDKTPIYKLILAGASDNLKLKLDTAATKVQGLLGPLSSQFDQFLTKVSGTAFQSLGGLTQNLDSVETRITTDINNKLSDLLDEIPNKVNNLINKHAAQKTTESKGI